MFKTRLLKSLVGYFLITSSFNLYGNNLDLFKAINRNDINFLVAEKLEGKKGIFNRAGHTLLYSAVELGHLKIVKHLLECGFDPNETNDLGRGSKILPKSVSTTNPQLLKYANQGELSPRKRSISYSETPITRTPITALLKTEPKDHDLEIAYLLLDYGASVGDSQKYGLYLPTDFLLKKLFDLSQTYQHINKPENKHFLRIKNLVAKSMVDADFRAKLMPLWYLFANSKTTAEIIDRLSLSGATKLSLDALKDFLPLVINWELDITTPTPDIALITYQKIYKLMSEEQKFIMLYKYLHLWSKKQGDVIHKNVTPISTRKLLALDPLQVAETIFFIDKQNFLAVPTKAITLKYSLRQSTPQLAQFISRIDGLGELVALSIVEAKKTEKAKIFWRDVALQLENFGDFFGLNCIRAGLDNPSVSRLTSVENITSKFVNVASHEPYRLAKEGRRALGFIPTIVKEGGLLENYLSNTETPDLFSDDKGGLADQIKRFEKEIDDARTALKQNERGHLRVDANLYGFLSTLKPLKNRTELLSLAKITYGKFPALSHPYAEGWDTRDFFLWWKTWDLKIKIRELIKLDISDGPSLLEEYAFHLAHPKHEISKSLENLFLTYKTYCEVNATTPLANINDKTYENKLILNPQSPFAWLMWLRNKGLAEEIPRLFANKIDNFETFLLERQMKGPFTSYGRDTNQALEQLFKTYELTTRLPEHIEDWELNHIEAWLFIKGLEHLTPAILFDLRENPHSFWAYCYFLKINSMEAIHSSIINDWMYPVLDEMRKEFSIEEALDRLSDTKVEGKELLASPLYFLSALRQIVADGSSMIDAIPKFYAANIFSFLAINKALKIKKNALQEIGLTSDQITKFNLYRQEKRIMKHRSTNLRLRSPRKAHENDKML